MCRLFPCIPIFRWFLLLKSAKRMCLLLVKSVCFGVKKGRSEFWRQVAQKHTTNNPLSKSKFHSLISLKRNSSFMRYLFIVVNTLKTFYTDIKILNVIKSRLCLKERWQILRVNNPKTVRIKDTQLPRFCFCMTIYVAQFPHL